MSPPVQRACRLHGASRAAWIALMVSTALGTLAGCSTTRTTATPPARADAPAAPPTAPAEAQSANAPPESAPAPPKTAPPETAPPADVQPAPTANVAAAPCVCSQPAPKPRPKKHEPKPRAAVTQPEPQSVGPVPPPTNAVVNAEVGRIDAPLTSILGKDVFSPKGENLGRVVDLLADSEGRVRVAIIDFGGFLGVGTRRIAVDWPLLHFTPWDKDKSLRLTVTREKLQSAPEYKDSDSPRVLVPPAATPDAAGAGTKK
jgi:hypothetical protein